MTRAAPIGSGRGLNGRGWLQGIEHIKSPHWNARPADSGIDLLVVHNISLPPGEFGGPWIERLFMGTLDPSAHPAFRELDGLRVSAHFLIRRDGSCIQFVSTEDRAWHAGLSSFMGREACNDYSLGVELEGSDFTPFTDAQYLTLIELTRAIQRHYPEITADRIVGHSDIAPDRKTDPGPHFDWDRFHAALAQKGAGGA